MGAVVIPLVLLGGCVGALLKLTWPLLGGRKLAHWFCTHHMRSSHVCWLIQVPRLFNIYAKGGMLGSFQDMLANVFLPIFEVTVDPSIDPLLAKFLESVSGFDSVDDESKPDSTTKFGMPTPDRWTKVSAPVGVAWCGCADVGVVDCPCL